MVNPFGPDDDFLNLDCRRVCARKKGAHLLSASISTKALNSRSTARSFIVGPASTRGMPVPKDKARDWSVSLEPAFTASTITTFEKTGPQEINLCWKRPGMENKRRTARACHRARALRLADITRIAFKDGRIAGTIRGNNQRLGYYWIGEKPFDPVRALLRRGDALRRAVCHLGVSPNKRLCRACGRLVGFRRPRTPFRIRSPSPAFKMRRALLAPRCVCAVSGRRPHFRWTPRKTGLQCVRPCTTCCVPSRRQPIRAPIEQ